MSDLRRRLEDAIEPHIGTDGSGVGLPVNDALAVFAGWLREQADEYRAMPDTGQLRRAEVDRALEAAGLLGWLADEISPKEES